jgi:glycine cleavage system H lipoate-binding protein/ABC-type phosphate transport system substrate-binding protein
MKTRICLLFAIFLLSYNISDSKEVPTSIDSSVGSTITVFTTPGLNNLTMKWINEYVHLNPNVKFNVIKSETNNLIDKANTGRGIGFTDNESWVAHNNQSIWSMVVGRDIIVPIMNAANPFRDEIVKKGLTPQGLMKALESPEKKNWGMLSADIQNVDDIPLHIYIMNDPLVLSGMENFLSTKSLNNEAIKASSSEEMISAIQKDPNALGFCKLIQVADLTNQSLPENIILAPIDRNGNGKIDYMENIYDNLQAFSRGVWIGKYPKALSGKIYTVTSIKPRNENEIAFLNWVLTDGQNFLGANGYSDLVLNERQSQLEKINEPVVYASSPKRGIHTFVRVVLPILLSLGIVAFVWNLLIRRIKNKKEAFSNIGSNSLPVFDEYSVIIPKGLYFDKTHTWAFMKKDGMVKIGIDDFLQHITGYITRIEMKKSGTKINKGDHLLTIVQKGKQLDIYSPMSGTIKAQNENLTSNPSLLNTSPYENGWVYNIEPTNWLLEIQFLSMADKYKTLLKNEFSRLKDFFATILQSQSPQFALITLQDGGAMKDGLLADLGPEIWDDFQTKFIDVAR